MHSIFRFGTALLLFCTLQLALVFSVRGQLVGGDGQLVDPLDPDIPGLVDGVEQTGISVGSATPLESEPAASGSVLFYNMWNIFTLLFASLVAMYRLF